MRLFTSLLAGILLLPLSAEAGPCDAHFTFDGSLADTGGSGNDGQFVGSSGEPIDMSGEFVAGKIGQALRLNGETTVFSELDLQTETCPQVSVTAWIFLEGFPKNSHGLISTGFGRGPRLAATSTNLNSWGGNNEIRAGLAIRPGIWIFIAGVWDYTAGVHRLYWRHRSMEEPLGDSNRPPQEGFWIGAYAYGSKMMSRANGILIDDVQVHGKALTEDEIHALRDAEFESNAQCDCGDTPATDRSDDGGSASSGSAAAGTVFATGPGQQSDVVTDTLTAHMDENRAPDITYDSEEEGLAAANAAEARREEERRTAQAEDDKSEQMPAPVLNAVMDLRYMRIDRQHERQGDEYYLVTYKFRGRRGLGDRIYTFDYAKQVWPLQAGQNWAKRSLEFTVPQSAGRLVFENLEPFEVYGFAAIVMEANRNSVNERTAAFGLGEFQNEAGVTEVLSSAFERAVPRTAAAPDYSDTSCQNTDSIYTENANGLKVHFGNYYREDQGLSKAIQDAIRLPLNRDNPDRFDGAFWSFSMNAPSVDRCALSGLAPTMFPQPGGPLDFRTESTNFKGEHSQYE